MKPDKLEKYMLDNKESFDNLEPDEQSWLNIEKRTRPVQKINYRRIIWQVAAGIAIFLASWVINDVVQNTRTDQLAENEDLLDSQAGDDMKVLMEAEVFYASKINSAKEEVFKLSGNNEDMMNIINVDLVELDDVFEDLKNDLKDNGDNQEVIEAMIQNYRLKLQILEEMLTQLNKSIVHKDKNKGYEI